MLVERYAAFAKREEVTEKDSIRARKPVDEVVHVDRRRQPTVQEVKQTTKQAEKALPAEKELTFPCRARTNRANRVQDMANWPPAPRIAFGRVAKNWERRLAQIPEAEVVSQEVPTMKAASSTLAITGLVLAIVALTPESVLAKRLWSIPLSHPSGFVAVVCQITNVSASKDVVVNFIDIDDQDATASFGQSISGDRCTGSPPWTLSPGTGCTATLNTTAACNQPDGCRCVVDFDGSAKDLRGNFAATVSGSTTTLTSELRFK